MRLSWAVTHQAVRTSDFLVQQLATDSRLFDTNALHITSHHISNHPITSLANRCIFIEDPCDNVEKIRAAHSTEGMLLGESKQI